MRFPRTCAMCNGRIAKQPRDELVVGPLAYCSATCRNLHLPTEVRRLRSAVLRVLGARRLPDAVRALLADAMKTRGAHG